MLCPNLQSFLILNTGNILKHLITLWCFMDAFEENKIIPSMSLRSVSSDETSENYFLNTGQMV